MEFSNKLGKRIRELRTKKQLTQDQVAEQAGISGKYLGQVERGEVNVSVIILDKLASVLDIKITEFFDASHIIDSPNLKYEIFSLLDKASQEEIKLIYRIVHAILR